MTPRTAFALCFAVLCGCASFDAPIDQLAKSQAAVRAAEESGADKLNPDSQLYLKLSREQLDKAKSLMEKDENELADRLLRRAEADAELAREIAHRETARAGAEDAKKNLQKLKPVN